MNDSFGNPDPIRYNAVHWDGTKLGVETDLNLYGGSIITRSLKAFVLFQKLIKDGWLPTN